MASERWRRARIVEVAERVAMGPFGSSIKVETFVPSGVPVISGQHLHGTKVDDGVGFNFVSEEHAARLKNANVQRGDIIFTHAGNIGQVAYVPEASEYERYVISQRQFYMRCDRSRVIPEFVVGYFKTAAGRHQLLANTSQVGVPSIAQPVTYLRTIEIPVPPLREQLAIAYILGILDNKIDLNRRMSETLEAMATAVFAARVQGTGRKHKASELITLGLLEIGDGYRAKNSEIGAPGLPFIRAGNLRGEIDAVNAELLNNASVLRAGTKTTRPDDVVFTSKGTVGRFARVSHHTPKSVYSPQVCYWRSLDPVVLPPTLLFLWMKSADMMLQIMAVAGQTDMAPYVSLRDQRQMDVPLFSGEALGTAQIVEPMLARQTELFAENRTLASLRDLLLPKLISGELRIKDAEKMVEAAPV